MTGFTGILQSKVQLFFTAEYGFLKSNPYRSMYIGTFHRAIIRSPSSAAEKIPENIAENVAHISAAETSEAAKSVKSSGSAASLFKGRMAELVILSSFLGVA